MVELRPSHRLVIKQIDPYRCVGCSVCMQSCMNDVIRMKSGKAYIKYQADCSQCFACVEDCPREAISLGWVNDDLYPKVESSRYDIQGAGDNQ